MKHAIAMFGLSFLLVAAPLAAQRDCTYGEPVSVVFGSDEGGYFIRAHWKDRFYEPRKGYDMAPIADMAGRRADATVLYATRYAERDLPEAEWHGPDPLSALRAFASAAGLQVETPQQGLWVVGTPESNERSATIVFARPLDPERQGFQPDEQVGDLERALVAQLPVRAACGCFRSCSIGVSYFWLPDEGRDVLLVQGTVPQGSAYVPRSSPIFKVRLDRSSPRVSVECLWSSSAIGPLVPDIAEDLDGDGYRDFVFDGVRYDGGYDVVLSGKDGHTLTRFGGYELLVEKTASGPKRIGVQRLGAHPTEHGSSHNNRPVVLTYSDQDRDYMPAPSAAQAVSATGSLSPTEAQPNIIDESRRAFITAVGAADKVRVYVMHQSPVPGSIPLEQIRVRELPLDVEVTPALVKSGYPARILFEYKSPSFLAYEELRAGETQ